MLSIQKNTYVKQIIALKGLNSIELSIQLFSLNQNFRIINLRAEKYKINLETKENPIELFKEEAKDCILLKLTFSKEATISSHKPVI